MYMLDILLWCHIVVLCLHSGRNVVKNGLVCIAYIYIKDVRIMTDYNPFYGIYSNI